MPQSTEQQEPTGVEEVATVSWGDHIISTLCFPYAPTGEEEEADRGREQKEAAGR
jgi:hypothetical protein